MSGTNVGQRAADDEPEPDAAAQASGCGAREAKTLGRVACTPGRLV
ncbi:hypothetical protein [Thiobacillus denitrificans]|nr:hypothetical protein [Thiobacillus denitrificans]